MWVLRVLILMLIIIIIIGFSIYNSSQKVTVNLFGHYYNEVPMIFVSYWAFVVGMLVSFILGITYYLKIHGELSQQKKETKRLLDEIKALRNMTLEDVEGK